MTEAVPLTETHRPTESRPRNRPSSDSAPAPTALTPT